MPDLFASGARVIVADAEGGIRYWPEWASLDEATEWFEALRAGAPWHQERRRMYDQMVEVPRLLASYRTPDLPPSLPLSQILERVQSVVPASYNAVGLNLYRDGRDSVAMHHDKLHTIVPAQPIALVSLGNARRMTLRARQGDSWSTAIDLEPGSLLVMSHASQLTHEHGIPKTARKVGARMSVVFRVRPEKTVATY